jgi:hypothetical protein
VGKYRIFHELTHREIYCYDSIKIVFNQYMLTQKYQKIAYFIPAIADFEFYAYFCEKATIQSILYLRPVVVLLLNL